MNRVDRAMMRLCRPFYFQPRVVAEAAAVSTFVVRNAACASVCI